VMTVMRLSALVLALGATACEVRRGSALTADDSLALLDRATRIEETLADSTTGAAREAPIARWILPPSLNEISGLALTSDGRLLAHSDEFGRVSVLDPRRGMILKEFHIGAKADFEGITIGDGTIYMVDSDGQIYSFREGDGGQRVRYVLHDTGLGRECEFEGIAFDPRRQALLLPCKNIKKKTLRNNVVIYVWQIDESRTPRLSVLAIPLRKAIGSNRWSSFRPTDITVDPRTGNYILIAAHERGLLELAPNGDVVASMPLPEGEQHAQAEGVAISEDGILIVSDEAAGRPASITLYRWPLVPAAQKGP
jgi:uncharacterized protein YjiK